MRVCSIILARGGSKGIPKKNIIPINDIPLLAYSINNSLKSEVDETWVSTDCIEIKNCALENGARVIDRPDALSTDLCKSDLSLLHFADNVNFDILVFLQPTSPLLNSEDINKGLKLIDNYDSIFTAYKEHWVPRWSEDMTPASWDINNRPMRQEVGFKYVENGAMYITTRQSLLQNKLRYGGKIGILEMPYHRSFQVDSVDELKLIQRIIQIKK